MSERRLTAAAFLAFVIGVGLMIPFEHPLTLAAGVISLLSFIVLGVFGLVTPDRLAGQPEQAEKSAADPGAGVGTDRS